MKRTDINGGQNVWPLWQNYTILSVLITHGFDSYYAIPFGDKTAVNGKWKQGPGMDLFKTLEKKLGNFQLS